MERNHENQVSHGGEICLPTPGEGSKKVRKESSLSSGPTRMLLRSFFLIAFGALSQSACLPDQAETQKTGEQERARIKLPKPERPLRTFTAEEEQVLRRNNWADELELARRYHQAFSVQEITWLLWGGIPPEEADRLLAGAEDRLEAIKAEIKKKYDARFNEEEKTQLIDSLIHPSVANSYPRVLSAEDIIDLVKGKPSIWDKISPEEADRLAVAKDRLEAIKAEIKKKYAARFNEEEKTKLIDSRIHPSVANSYPRVLPAKEIIDLVKGGSLISPEKLRERWNDDDLKFFVEFSVKAKIPIPIRKTLDYPKEWWNRDDVANLIRKNITPDEAREFLEIKTEEGTENFIVKKVFPGEHIARIHEIGYTAKYVRQFTRGGFKPASTFFFIENGIPLEEAKAKFPRRLYPEDCLKIQRKREDFPLGIIDEYPEHWDEEDVYEAAMAGMGVGYAKAYPERFSGVDAVLLWKNGIFGKEAGTYAEWLEAEEIVRLKKAGIEGPQTMKYREDFPIEEIIKQERKHKRSR